MPPSFRSRPTPADQGLALASHAAALRFRFQDGEMLSLHRFEDAVSGEPLPLYMSCQSSPPEVRE